MDQPMDVEVNKDTAVLEKSLSAVTYCCRSCGYDLGLRSSDRNTAAGILGGYSRGMVSFDVIDDVRFGHAEDFRCLDVRAHRLFVRRTRPLCCKCGISLGFGYDDRAAAAGSSFPATTSRSVGSRVPRSSGGSAPHCARGRGGEGGGLEGSRRKGSRVGTGSFGGGGRSSGREMK